MENLIERELIHGTIERIPKTFVIKRCGIGLSVHETAIIYDAIKKFEEIII